MTGVPVLSLWRARRGRKAAVAALMPYIDETRRHFGPNCDTIWESPYTIGFLTNLITLTATEAADPDPDDALGLVQSESWRALTGVSANLIGERISLLSIAGNEEFVRGRDNGAKFFQALQAHRGDTLQLTADFLQASAATRGSAARRPSATLAHLWDELLHAQIQTSLGAR